VGIGGEEVKTRKEKDKKENSGTPIRALASQDKRKTMKTR
jgi:hypothetical protein